MKKTSKIALILIIVAIAIFAAIIYAIKISSNVTLLNFFTPQKFTSISNVHIAGKEGKNKSWEIKADECWAGKDKHRSFFENVHSCTIYEDSYLIVKDLTARRIIVNSSNKDIEIFKNVDGKGWLTASIDFNRTNNKGDYSTLYADYIKFNPNTNKALVKDNILIIKEDLTIEAKAIVLDLDNNIADIHKESKYTKGDDLIIGQSAKALLDKDTINCKNGL